MAASQAPPPPPAWQPPPPQMPPAYPPAYAPAPAPKKSHTGLIIAVAVVVIVVVVLLAAAVVFLAAPKPSGSGSPPPSGPPAPTTIVQSGQVYQLPGAHYEYLQFDLTTGSAVAGSFTATNGVFAYIMTPSSYANFSSSGTASSYDWTSGDVSTGSMNVNLNAGTWYLVFDNPSAFTTTSVDVTQAIVATPL